jgi:hypothetical protein
MLTSLNKRKNCRYCTCVCPAKTYEITYHRAVIMHYCAYHYDEILNQSIYFNILDDVELYNYRGFVEKSIPLACAPRKFYR